MSELVPTFIIEPILSDDELKVSLRATARIVDKSNCKAITSEAIQQLLEQRGFARYRIIQEQIDEIVN
ncbi:MAG: hypothetical protein ACI9N9_001539, partial [Enterobacterales bacterium]